jgi:outer membrane protein TolC
MTGAMAAATRESLQKRSDVLAALANYESAQAALELEAAKQVPDLHLGPGYQWDQGANKWSLALTLELPLFHRNEAPIAEAAARRAEAAAQFVLVQAQALAAIESAVAAQSAATSQLERAHQLSAESEQQRALVQQRVALGAADQLELQTARLDLATTELARLDAETAAAQASGQLEDALQVPFPHLAALADVARATSSRTP